MNHGRPDSNARHVGDLGNIVSMKSTGTTNIFVVDKAISLLGGNFSSILDRSIVIHEQPDNFAGSSGNAGPRISCGVIGEGVSNNGLDIKLVLLIFFLFQDFQISNFSSRIKSRMSFGLYISKRGCNGRRFCNQATVRSKVY